MQRLQKALEHVDGGGKEQLDVHADHLHYVARLEEEHAAAMAALDARQEGSQEAEMQAELEALRQQAGFLCHSCVTS